MSLWHHQWWRHQNGYFLKKTFWPFFDNSQGLLWHICPFLGRKRLKNSIFSHLTPLNAIMTSSVMTSSKWVFFQKKFKPFFDSSQGLLWHIFAFLGRKRSKNSIFSQNLVKMWPKGGFPQIFSKIFFRHVKSWWKIWKNANFQKNSRIRFRVTEEKVEFWSKFGQNMPKKGISPNIFQNFFSPCENLAKNMRACKISEKF